MYIINPSAYFIYKSTLNILAIIVTRERDIGTLFIIFNYEIIYDRLHFINFCIYRRLGPVYTRIIMRSTLNIAYSKIRSSHSHFVNAIQIVTRE